MVAAGAGAATEFVLVVVTALTRSWTLGIVTVGLGCVLIVAGCAMAARYAERFVTTNNRLATLAGNVERRSVRMADRAREIEDSLSGVMDDISQLRNDVVAIEHQIAGLTVDGATVREGHAELHERVVALSKDVQILRRRVPANLLEPVKSDIAIVRRGAREAMRIAFESAVHLGRAPQSVITANQADNLFQYYLARDELLQLRPLIEGFGLLEKQDVATLRRLYRFYRRAGYWDLAAATLVQTHAKTGRDVDAHALTKVRHEIELFSRPTAVVADLPDGIAHDVKGPILHMVGRVLPETQTGYTLRTHYTAMAQARTGLPVAIVGQTGITERRVEAIEHYVHEEIDYYLLPGAPRSELLLDEWLRQNIVQLGELVRRVRPSVLHAHSDFFNALIVSAVGAKYGIPTVYESRGFWEESWLSRTITAHDWSDSATSLFTTYGEPDAYELRKRAEETARLLADHVFTLADVMREYIVDSARGQLSKDDVTIVPNAVESTSFPVQERDDEFAAQIGLPDGAVTIGYISSMVEYEGVDTLIDAFHLVSSSSSRPMCLLLVGDGDHLPKLRERVESRDIENVIFTGRVPHGDVLRYYGLIDVFVVPRKRSTVTDLVTPLKPFEAFSTGRAVMLSDVGALREIAEQSGVVETFRAGSAEDLAAKLEALIDDPRRRHEMGERAARWVRTHRSWDGNVIEYQRVYRALGYAGEANLLVQSEIALIERGVNRGELLEALASADLPPVTGWFGIEEGSQTASEILEEGWRFQGFEPVPVADIDDWGRYGKEHRSWGFQLHKWEFMDPLIREFDQSGERRWIDEAVRIARGWVEIHRVPEVESDPMAWYDMSLALRTPRLIALALRAARIEDLRDDALVLAEAVAVHLDELHRERAFNPNNNHGFYTAASQVHAAKYAWMFPDVEATALEGRERLAKMVMSQFATDGSHLEHSPDYHRMLLNSFELAISDGLIEDEDVKERVERAAHVLGWMVQPDGTLVQFGDTPERRVVHAEARSIDPQTQYILSDGERGERPTDELAVLPAGGYAFVRSPQPQRAGALGDSGYLAFSAAFHSRAHKHADDLNVVWFDRGQQILTDSGRFGYGELLPADSPLRREGFYYATPERQYVEGTMAHNTLMMDGRNQDRKARPPYGSGIGECTQRGRVFDLSGRVHHGDYVHRRRLVYRPGKELLIKDAVFSQTSEVREGTLWFNISGHFELESVDEESVVFTAAGEAGETRLVVSGTGRLVEPIRGQADPMRGWRSREDQGLEPTWSVGFAVTVDTRAAMETCLRLE
jgi:glycosyltransferase involved in cell wall biosynthesis